MFQTAESEQSELFAPCCFHMLYITVAEHNSGIVLFGHAVSDVSTRLAYANLPFAIKRADGVMLRNLFYFVSLLLCVLCSAALRGDELSISSLELIKRWGADTSHPWRHLCCLSGPSYSASVQIGPQNGNSNPNFKLTSFSTWMVALFSSSSGPPPEAQTGPNL